MKDRHPMKSTMIDRDRQPLMSFLRFLLLGAITFCGAVPLLAGEQTPTVVPRPVLRADAESKAVTSEVLPKTTISKSELHRHVATLASDEFKGRDPAGEGGILAAKYLANEFKKLGLKPDGDDGKYFQNFTGSRARSRFWLRGRHTSSKSGSSPQKSDSKVVASTEGTYSTEEAQTEGHTASSDEGSEKKSGSKEDDEGEEDDDDEGDDEGDGPKPPMSDEEMEEAAKKVCDWFSRTFSDSPQGQEPNCEEFACRNVLGFLPGSDPDLKDEVIIVSAHFDHLGVRRGKVYNGADDNASGTASMLELARVLKNRKEGLRRSILFAAWDGEEKGLLGSSHWTQSPTVSIDQVVAVINLDMIGRLRNDKLIVLGSGSSDQLSDIINDRAKRAKLNLLEWKRGGNSDHWPFCVVGIPSITFCTGIHKDYHAPTDDIERVRFTEMERIVRMTLGLVGELANRDARVEFTCDQ